MDSDEEVEEYNGMVHGGVNVQFCRDLLALDPDLDACLDIGTGTALIPIELCNRAPQARVTATDLASTMLECARRNVARAGHEGRIRLATADAKDLAFDDSSFSCVFCNSIIHHIADPRPVFREALRVLRAGGTLFIRDLFRPESEAELQALVARYAGDESPRQQQLLADSLRAAFTVAELRALVADVGIPRGAVAVTSDRHWTVTYKPHE